MARPGGRSMAALEGPRGRWYTGEDAEVWDAGVEILVVKPGWMVDRDGGPHGGGHEGTNDSADGGSWSSSRWLSGVGT
jgi:hypothetical protein